MPEQNSWASLGALLGGGAQAARDRGFNEGMQGRLLTSKTEEAIINARLKRDEMDAINEMGQIPNEVLQSAGVPQAVILRAHMGPEWAALQRGRLDTQAYGNHQTLADELSTPDQMAHAQYALQGKYEPLQTLGAGNFYALAHPDEIKTTPLGESMITENLASAAKSNMIRERGSHVPSGYEIDPDTGGLKFIPGGPADPSVKRSIADLSQPSEGERKDASQAQRLLTALKDMESGGPEAAKPGVMEALAGSIPGIGDVAANSMRDPQRQIVAGAQADAVDAILTLGTGAAYTEQQLKAMRQAYLPALGDSPEALAAKRNRLAGQVALARQRAGRANPSIDAALMEAERLLIGNGTASNAHPPGQPPPPPPAVPNAPANQPPANPGSPASGLGDSPDNPITVATGAEARALAVGKYFMTPDGRVMRR
jgi:hypothetical protein